ncbi:hypothetical protein [Xanthomonas graminis]|jgi:hypothetical protein|uniref:hypothetical protein n=1 Tax=Xanthomonas graminis TaxID=3390026 RepID=UPI000AD4D6B1|nr:hypothetical protein [Xanthomonas translucens]
MKFFIIVLSFLGLTACSASAGSSGSLGYIVPGCEQVGASDEIKKWPASEYLFESSKAKQVCAQPISSGLKIDAPLRIVPYKNGLIDVEFECSHQDSMKFFKKNAGKEVIFVAGNEAVVKARVPENPTDDRCALLGQTDLKESVSICEAFAHSLNKDKGKCVELCSQSDSDWACVVHN